MSFIFGVIALITCSYIGYLCSKKYIDKRDFYNDFNNFNLKLKNAVSFNNSTIISLIESCDKKSLFYDALRSCFTKSIKIDFTSVNYLSKAEIDFLNSYLDLIGSVDRNTQINYLNEVSNKLQENLNEAILEEKKYKTLYIKIGFLVGLIVFVVAI